MADISYALIWLLAVINLKLTFGQQEVNKNDTADICIGPKGNGVCYHSNDHPFEYSCTGVGQFPDPYLCQVFYSCPPHATPCLCLCQNGLMFANGEGFQGCIDPYLATIYHATCDAFDNTDYLEKATAPLPIPPPITDEAGFEPGGRGANRPTERQGGQIVPTDIWDFTDPPEWEWYPPTEDPDHIEGTYPTYPKLPFYPESRTKPTEALPTVQTSSSIPTTKQPKPESTRDDKLDESFSKPKLNVTDSTDTDTATLPIPMEIWTWTGIMFAITLAVIVMVIAIVTYRKYRNLKKAGIEPNIPMLLYRRQETVRRAKSKKQRNDKLAGAAPHQHMAPTVSQLYNSQYAKPLEDGHIDRVFAPDKDKRHNQRVTESRSMPVLQRQPSEHDEESSGISHISHASRTSRNVNDEDERASRSSQKSRDSANINNTKSRGLLPRTQMYDEDIEDTGHHYAKVHHDTHHGHHSENGSHEHRQQPGHMHLDHVHMPHLTPEHGLYRIDHHHDYSWKL
ncbi:unnamed protein product [Owenia fusiformis]|uniref:Chitin-binding type-2 domain-containing protein n=1 Tax=Owenia fusiformis TaxID=6347 RepID=A0A8S4N494_OWEFU|nr:unnamed protein product [Owenia fusiformis]